MVAEGLADLMYDAVVSTGQWDGVFFDVYCYTISWSQDGTRQIDYARAGSLARGVRVRVAGGLRTRSRTSCAGSGGT